MNETVLTEYLLGRLSEEEQARVEDRAFADADYRRALEAAEADLIDSYVRGELGRAERDAFERRFLTSPQRRSKVEFAKALAAVTAESQPPASERRPRWHSLLDPLRGSPLRLRFAAGLAALICVAGASVLLWKEEAPPRFAAGGPRKTQSPAVAQPPLAASLVLPAGISRAEARVGELVLKPEVQLARIEMQLEARDDYPQFHAELRTRAGNEVLVRSGLERRVSAGGYAVAIDVPANALAAGDYELALEGLPAGRPAEPVGFYYFSVTK